MIKLLTKWQEAKVGALVLGVLGAIVLLVAGRSSSALAQSTPSYYTLPSSNTIQWVDGSDVWNGGVLPNYTSVTCSGLPTNGTTDATAAINACLKAAAKDTAVYLPAGTYYVNGLIELKSYTVLRGAGPSTIINLGAGGQLTTQPFGPSSDITPGDSYGATNAGYSLAGAPQKGTTQLTIASGNVAVGDWISVFSNDDPSLVTATGDYGFCEWCGDNDGKHLIQQIVQVTAVNGSNITISKPLYYTLYTDPQYKIYNFQTEYAGYESFRVNGQGDIGSNSMIFLNGTLDSWVKGVESYDTGSDSGSAHIEMDWTYGSEIDDNYVHYGRSSASGANYGIYFQFVNSDAKVQNNIMVNNRHAIVFQGGGSGIAILYNYMDDMYTDDLTYLGSARTSHGADPYMNLYEGNVISHLAADDYWGSSSYITLFRNAIWGDETGDNVPQKPNYAFIPLEIWANQYYYSVVGNVLGNSTKWDAVNFSTYPVVNTNCANQYATNAMIQFGCHDGVSTMDPKSESTAIVNGNYDAHTGGVATWLTTNHTLAPSMYYASKPSWWPAATPWPAIGPDVAGLANVTPAQACYTAENLGALGTFNAATCYPTDFSGSGGGGTVLPPPTVTAPAITSALTASATAGSAFSYQIAASNGPTSYSATGLPTGLTVSAVGLISGTPSTAATYSVTISATNSGGTGTATLKITVAAAVTTPTSYTLTITKSGTGSGTVTGGAVNCGSTCSASIAKGTAVTLTATAASGSTFSGWSGGCTGTGACSITMNAAVNVTAIFTANTVTPTSTVPAITSALMVNATAGSAFSYQITASNNPRSYAAIGLPSGLTINTATGLISGTPTGGTTATTYNVTLDALNTSGTGAATLKIAVSAVAAQQVSYTLTASSAGSGSGTMTVAGKSCGASCTATVTSNGPTSVTLTEAPSSGSTFSGWSGACTGTGTSCTFTIGANESITATFTANAVAPTSTTPAAPVLTSLSPSTGAVGTSITISGANFGATSTILLNGMAGATGNTRSGSMVTFSIPSSLEAYCVGNQACPQFALIVSAGTYSVTVISNGQTSNALPLQVTGAGTSPNPQYTLTVTNAGNGSGSVTGFSITCGAACTGSNTVTTVGQSTIDCGSVCSETLTATSEVTLTESAASGSTFSGWSGACTGTASSCTVTMGGNENVTATFISTSGSGGGTGGGGTAPTCTPPPVAFGCTATLTNSATCNYSVSCGSGSAPTSTTPTSTSPSYPNHHINRYLRRGSQGDDVQWLQLWLFQNGYYPQDLITGYYGDLTQSAVQNYQSKNGIVSSGSPDSTGWGNVGPRTEQEINQQSGD